MEKYISRPRMSFTVVTKGPVANAGSILYFSNVRGVNVPNKAAKIMTTNNEILTVQLSSKLYPRAKVEANINIEQIIPFNNPTPNSFSNF